jgi:hypothetical protein
MEYYNIYVSDITYMPELILDILLKKNNLQNVKD